MNYKTKINELSFEYSNLINEFVKSNFDKDKDFYKNIDNIKNKIIDKLSYLINDNKAIKINNNQIKNGFFIITQSSRDKSKYQLTIMEDKKTPWSHRTGNAKEIVEYLFSLCLSWEIDKIF